jgi:hypothetical protein
MGTALTACKSVQIHLQLLTINHFLINKYRSVLCRDLQTIFRKVVNNEKWLTKSSFSALSLISIILP